MVVYQVRQIEYYPSRGNEKFTEDIFNILMNSFIFDKLEDQMI